MVRSQVKVNRTYFDCISAIVNIDKRHFADVCPVMRAEELLLHAPALERAPSSKGQVDFARGD